LIIREVGIQVCGLSLIYLIVIPDHILYLLYYYVFNCNPFSWKGRSPAPTHGLATTWSHVKVSVVAS